MRLLQKKLLRARVLIPLAVVLAAALWYWHPWQPRIVIRERINPKDGAVMVWVPAGKFCMGSNLHDATHRHDWTEMPVVLWRRLHGEVESDEEPSHTVYLNGYWIYKYEVTVAQYRAFCRATKRTMPPARPWGWQDNYPIVNVYWQDAVAYARWAGAALPTEAEWEKAARGTDERVFPWGNAWDGAKCCSSVLPQHVSSPSPIGSYPAGASPYGVQDLAGNVWEWCADWYAPTYYSTSPTRNPSGPATGTTRVLRGGSWFNDSPAFFRAINRDAYSPINRAHGRVGFRCVVHSPGP